MIEAMNSIQNKMKLSRPWKWEGEIKAAVITRGINVKPVCGFSHTIATHCCFTFKHVHMLSNVLLLPVGRPA